MKIKKVSEEVNYFEETRKHLFEVNGKKVEVITWVKQNNVESDYDNDETVDEDDAKALSEVELEAVGENLTELLDLKEGEEYPIEEYTD